jgi:hypothetical protein
MKLFLAIAGVFTFEFLLVMAFLFRLRERIDQLNENFTNHFHGADELQGFTNPPIMPTEQDNQQ